jgi:hypothetical protein
MERAEIENYIKVNSQCFVSEIEKKRERKKVSRPEYTPKRASGFRVRECGKFTHLLLIFFFSFLLTEKVHMTIYI